MLHDKMHELSNLTPIDPPIKNNNQKTPKMMSLNTPIQLHEISNCINELDQNDAYGLAKIQNRMLMNAP